jgi:hypothetical protein
MMKAVVVINKAAVAITKAAMQWAYLEVRSG